MTPNARPLLLLVTFITLSLPGLASDLPDSLANWYKPHNERQIWLHTMFSLRREMQAVEEYGQQGDYPAAQRWAAEFIQHYRSLGDMVPAWADELELDALEQLHQALSQQDPVALRSALKSLNTSCRSCHSDYRALAAARFRSPDFTPIRIDDGEGQQLRYAEAMEALSLNINRIKIATEDGHWERADSALNRLRQQLHQLADSCHNCHRDPEPRERILGTKVQQTLDQLAQAIREHNPSDSGRHLGSAAVAVCARCHGVHRTLAELRDKVMKP